MAHIHALKLKYGSVYIVDLGRPSASQPQSLAQLLFRIWVLEPFQPTSAERRAWSSCYRKRLQILESLETFFFNDDFEAREQLQLLGDTTNQVSGNWNRIGFWFCQRAAAMRLIRSSSCGKPVLQAAGVRCRRACIILIYILDIYNTGNHCMHHEMRVVIVTQMCRALQRPA